MPEKPSPSPFVKKAPFYGIFTVIYIKGYLQKTGVLCKSGMFYAEKAT